MTTVHALDSKITPVMFLKSLGDKFKMLLASTMSPEEKLAQIIKAMESDVQERRVLARQIGAQKRALADPDTKELEPLEALRARRAKLVLLGSKNLENPERLGQIQNEITGLDVRIASQEATYGTLDESYELAKGNYQASLAALENTRSNGPAILKAIRAHQDALAMRDKAASSTSVDASFMNDLVAELGRTQAELRSDHAIENDLDATVHGSLDAELAKIDAATVDEGLMAEFRAAAHKAGPNVAGAAK